MPLKARISGLFYCLWFALGCNGVHALWVARWVLAAYWLMKSYLFFVIGRLERISADCYDYPRQTMAGITDKEVRSLIAKAKSEGRTATQADGTIPGLTLTVSKTGMAAWVLRYYALGKQKEMTISQYPTWGIADARGRAKKLRQAGDDGVDVAMEKQKWKKEALSAVTVDMLPMATLSNGSPFHWC